MTENNKMYTAWGKRIKRNGTLLNIEFKTKVDARLCCKLLNQQDNDISYYINHLDEICTWHKKHYGKSILDERLEFKSDCEKENELLKKENEQLKDSNQGAIELIYDAIVEMHDGKRDYAEEILNKAIELILMTEKKRFTLKNWDNYAEGDCIYYDNGEEMGSLDVLDTLNNLSEENDELKRVLGSILLEVKREINNTCQSGEVRAFVNPKSYNLISDVLKKYNPLVN